MNTEEKSANKFVEGQRVALKGAFRVGQASEEGVVDHYENYHGVRVWIKALDDLFYAYPEEDLVALEEIKVVRHFEGLTKAAEEQNAGSIMVSQRLARGVLDYIAELEGKVEAAGLKELDNVSDLKVGDKVETLIDYTFHSKGTRGVVERVDQTEYPIMVRFEGVKYPVGYQRFELGKVT